LWRGIEMQKFLILMMLLLVVPMLMERSEIRGEDYGCNYPLLVVGYGSNYPPVVRSDAYWAEWEYLLVYQYANVFPFYSPVYVFYKEKKTRGNSLLQGKQLNVGNGGRPMEGKTFNSISTEPASKLAQKGRRIK